MNATPKQVIQELSELALRLHELEKSPAMDELRKGPTVLQAMINYAVAGRKSMRFNVKPGEETARTTEMIKSMGFTCDLAPGSDEFVTVLEISW